MKILSCLLAISLALNLYALRTVSQLEQKIDSVELETMEILARFKEAWINDNGRHGS